MFVIPLACLIAFAPLHTSTVRAQNSIGNELPNHNQEDTRKPSTSNRVAPPKRLGLAITGTILAGQGLGIIIGSSIAWADLQKNPLEEGQGAVILHPKIFLALGSIMVAAGGLMATFGWINYARWKRWTRSQQAAIPMQQLGNNPMLRLKLHSPQWSTGLRATRYQSRNLGLGWSGRF